MCGQDFTIRANTYNEVVQAWLSRVRFVLPSFHESAAGVRATDSSRSRWRSSGVSQLRAYFWISRIWESMVSPTFEAGSTLNANGMVSAGVLEHDASLSRSNFKVGNNIAYNETLWNQAMSFNAPGATHWTPQAGAGNITHLRSHR